MDAAPKLRPIPKDFEKVPDLPSSKHSFGQRHGACEYQGGQGFLVPN
jgi:hypothetical protein